ncbi:AAA family ATPase [Candidatus Magnetomoraceae bacterium gMMP-13]
MIKRIPYGISDFERINKENYYYVDKTEFIPVLESMPPFIFFIRPRRFGKSLWLSVLESYYDINKKDQFEKIFKGTYISEHPTDEKNSYMILYFNFSVVNPDLRFIEESFESNCNSVIRYFLMEYQDYFDKKTIKYINSIEKAEAKLRELFECSRKKNLRIYLLIDEYDNFSNTILSTHGRKSYEELTHGSGFFRFFFNLFKGGTSGSASALAKLFITGVSPITMDDVTSGFNIGDSITLEREFNELLGFTEKQVSEILFYYYKAGLLKLKPEFCLNIMKKWYNKYYFSKKAASSVFNSDMVLYFVKQAIREDSVPDKMIDKNIRIDYEKLRYLILINNQLNGNFSRLKDIMETGEVISDIEDSFPLERLLDHKNFISLLFYFGLLSIDRIEDGCPVLCIPNFTVKQLMYSYLRDAYQDVDIFRPDLWNLSNLLRGMAYHGKWKPVFDFFTDEIEKQTAIRDYLNGEKVIQGFLLAYLNIMDLYLTQTKQDMKKGFSDLYLEPFSAKYPDMRFAYLIELKYISRGEFSETRLKKEINQAEAQINQYAESERVLKTLGNTTLKKLVLIYKGWELVYREEVF